MRPKTFLSSLALCAIFMVPTTFVAQNQQDVTWYIFGTGVQLGSVHSLAYLGKCDEVKLGLEYALQNCKAAGCCNPRPIQDLIDRLNRGEPCQSFFVNGIAPLLHIANRDILGFQNCKCSSSISTNDQKSGCGFAMSDLVYMKWMGTGGEFGRLHCPVHEERPCSSASGIPGAFVRFDGGDGAYIIYQKSGSQQNKAYIVEGCVFKVYLELGGTTSWLGYPTSDEYDVAGGRRSDFENGYILWDTSTRQCRAYRKGETPQSPVDDELKPNSSLSFDPVRRLWCCAKCSGLNFVGHGAYPNVCAAGGVHDNKDYVPEYEIRLGDNKECNGRLGWAFCEKCSLLWYLGKDLPQNYNAPCAKGGSHVRTLFLWSYDIVLCSVENGITGTNYSSGWHKCSKCRILYNGDGAHGKACAAGGKHDKTGSQNYAIKEFK